jgi:hypothetical protein
MKMITPSEKFLALNDFMELENALANLVEQIREQEYQREKIAGALKRLKAVPTNSLELPAGEIVDDKLFKAVARDELQNLSAIGVDSSIITKQFHGLDLMIVRPIAVRFSYEHGCLFDAEYFPSEMPSPKLIPFLDPMDAYELEVTTNAERQLAELKIAYQTLCNGGADLLLLDGSILPQYVDRLSFNIKFFDIYRKLLDAFSSLYQACEERVTLLAGVIKDSRSKRLIDLLGRKILPEISSSNFLSSDDLAVISKNLDILERSKDVVFLNHILNVGERSFAFKYSDSLTSSPTLKEIEALSSKIFAFYIKTAPFDYPFRVEFIDFADNPQKTADRVASLIYALSSHHDAFGLPSVLIEADTCARLNEEDLDIVQDSIMDRLGPSMIMDLRRDRRPF